MKRPDHLVEIFLGPGEHFFGDRSYRIRTLLGSCVSLVFWHPRLLVGGMCHYMLPTRRPKPAGPLDGRYGDEALALMLGEIRGAGAHPRDFRIRLFGGGNMFPAIRRTPGGHIGTKNVEAAREILKAHHLRLFDEHVEGVGHRNLIFDVWNGHVALKHLAPHPAAPGGGA